MKHKKLRIGAIAFFMALAMTASSVSAFAASYTFPFGSLTTGPSSYTSGALVSSSTSDQVTQTSSSTYTTTYYLVASDKTTVASNSVSLASAGTKYFTFKSGYGGSGQTYYLRGVAPNSGGRPGYTAKGNWYI